MKRETVGMRDGFGVTTRIFGAALAASLGAWRTPAARADLVVDLQHGDKVQAALDPGFEGELHRIQVPEGATVTFKVSCAKTAGPLQVLLRTDGGDSSFEGTKLVVPFTAPVSQRVELEVRQDGGNGPLPYKLSVSIRYGAVGPVTAEAPSLAVAAFPGSRAKFAVKAAAGSSAVPAITEVRNPEGEPVATAPGPKATVACALFGNYTADASDGGGDGGDSTLTCVLKAPKSKRKIDLRPQKLQEDVSDVIVGALGPAGGTIVAPEGSAIDGASLDVPPQALTLPTTLLLGRAGDLNLIEGFAGIAAGVAVFFGPEGTNFRTEVTLTLPFDTSIIGSGDPVRVFRRDADGTVVEITGFTIDLLAGTVALQADHFSVYQVFRAAPLPVSSFLTPSGVPGDAFGRDVAVDGNLAAVGAPGRTVAMETFAGGVVVLERSGGSWAIDETIDNPLANAPGGAADLAGISVAVDDDDNLLVVGAPYAGAQNDGRVLVYRRSAGNWNLEQTLLDATGTNLQAFGSRVAADGATIAVATPFNPLGGGNNGSVFVFKYTGSWALEQQIDAPVLPHLFGSFGNSLSLSGDRLLVGDPNAANGAASNTGAVYVYKRTAGIWNLEHTISGEEFAAGSEFGWSVAEDSGVAVIGIPSDGAGGAAAVFVRDAGDGSWDKVELLTGPTAGGDFGKGVAIAGEILAIGEPGFPTALGAQRGGRVHVFRRDAVLGSRRVLTREGPGAGEFGEYGNAVHVSGFDLMLGWNGDVGGSTFGAAEFLGLGVLSGL